MRRAIVSTKGIVSHPTDEAALVEAMKATEKFLWLDIENPGPEDLKLLLDGFGFHPLSIEDLTQTHTAAKLDEYDNYVFQVVMIPFADREDAIDLFEVEIFYLKGTLVTVRGRSWAAIEQLWQAVQRDPARELGKGAQVLYHSIVDRAVDEYFPLLDRLDDRIGTIEEEVLAGRAGREILSTLFLLRRGVRVLLRSARNQRESVQRLAVGTVRTLTKETCYQFRDVHDHLILVHDSLDDHRETLGGLRDTYLGVLNNRMSEVMKTLTLFSALLLPLAFITGLFGMNVPLPLREEPASFWIVLGLCLVLSLGGFRFMAKRGWLRRMD
ncbi:MAG TPA: magnesium transporter CorA family protein [Planctomycetota bacterium]|nr:magnesium transporter CorA family protein [Planctomycetota bacterium]